MKSECTSRNCKTARFRPIVFSLTVVLIALALAGAPALAQRRRADLSRLVIVGDSLSAGFQNGSLLSTQQANSYPNLIATQANTPLAQPLIAPPGIPNVLTLVSPGPPPVIVPAPGASPGREDIFVQVTNLAVPGHRVGDALSRRPDFPIDSLTDLVLGLPGLLGGVSRSQVEWAEAMQPTTIVIWIGNNDALGAALIADPIALTPVPVFEAQYTEMMNRLSATGAKLVVANVPDVTAVPFLTSAEQVAELVGLPLAVIGPPLGIAASDFVTPDAFPLIGGILTGQIAGPLPGNVVLTAAEVAAVRAATAAYNSIIAAQAAAKGAALVDTHALLSSLQARGLVVNGQRLTTQFLGGIVSLDGIHPTDTGYALVANEFIHTLNARFAAGIPPLALEHVAMDDPLVFPTVGRPAAALGHIRPETAQAMRAIFVH
jgi:lysophospholipase L1-like esterase